MIPMHAVLGFLLALPFALIVILATVFWIWMLIDCALHESSQGTDKIVLILIILFTHFIGAAVYFLVRRPRRASGL